ncbi:MAG: adenylate/guanylate cyclase domain-containing protein [Anaerolineae bacterium]|nr:adenylate/guanylate cyclase domain-containing protein [Anaerolineae bacterium]
MSAIHSLLRRADQFLNVVIARLPPPLNDLRVRFRLQAGAAIALVVAFLVILLLFSGLVAPLNRVATDFLYHAAVPQPQIALIAIDKKSLDAIGTFPWSRAIHAELLDILRTAPPRVIAFDIVFSQASSEDPVLAASIRQSGNVLLAAAAEEGATLPPRPESILAYTAFVSPVPTLAESAQGIGHRIINPDPDNITRRMPLGVQAGTTSLPPLGLLAFARYSGITDLSYKLPERIVAFGPYRVPVDEYGNTLLNLTSPNVDVATYSFVDVLQGVVPPQVFADKLVFIGGNSTIETEQYAIPLQLGEARTYNVNLQADFANMMLSQPPQTLQAQGALGQLALILAMALLAGLTLPHLRSLYAVALTLVYLVGLLLFSFDAFNRAFVIPLLYPALALILTSAAIITFRYFSEDRRRQFLTSLFRRYVPADILGRVIDAIDRGELPLTGARRMVTVLYADLRGFATISDEMTPEVILQTVNRYMELSLQAISGQGGTVSKPMGDALIAVWNAPLDQIDHCARGLYAAVAIRNNLLEYQKKNQEREKFSVGIGLATGWAVMGNITALGKVEYTLVGDTVNVAARISAFANNNQILADAATAEKPPDRIVLRELSPVRVRGRKEPLAVWEVRETSLSVESQEEEEEEG